jgi:hypothetical protein
MREENKKLKSDLEKFSDAYKEYWDYENEKITESYPCLTRDKGKLKKSINN